MKKTLIGFTVLAAAFCSFFAIGAAVDTAGNAVTTTTDLGDIDTDATTVGDFKNVLVPGYDSVAGLAKYGVWYATCPTAQAAPAKVATTVNSGFQLATGVCVSVKFSQTNNSGAPSLNVNSTGAKAIKAYGTTSPGIYSWKANQVVNFIYDGTNWQMLNPPPATTLNTGIVALSSSTNSTSTALAATASAVRDVRLYVDTATAGMVKEADVTNIVWNIYSTSQKYLWDSATETCYRQTLNNDFYILEAVTNVYPTAAVIRALETEMEE